MSWVSKGICVVALNLCRCIHIEYGCVSNCNGPKNELLSAQNNHFIPFLWHFGKNSPNFIYDPQIHIPTNMTGLPSLSRCQGSDSDMECNGKLSMRRAISILGVDMLELIFSPHLDLTKHMGVNPTNRGYSIYMYTPKMDGENNGKPY